MLPRCEPPSMALRWRRSGESKCGRCPNEHGNPRIRMRTRGRMAKRVMERESQLCPVCWHEDAFDSRGAILGIGCKHGHAVCVTCARKLSYVTGPCSCTDKESCFCTGLAMNCPICRSDCRLQPRHVHALLQGSWDEARRIAKRLSPANARFGTRACEVQ